MFMSYEVFLVLFSFASAQNAIGNFCRIKGSESLGVCTPFSKCAEVQDGTYQYPKRFPQICGFQESELVVCCPQQKRVPGEISYKKCEEYAEASATKSSKCGYSEVLIDTRIIGGSPASKREFPHMAAIGYRELSGELSWRCGGTLISEKFVLTAAHCLYDNRNKIPATLVTLGVTKLNDSRHRQDFSIADMIAHPDYEISSFYNDIGLIKLSEPAIFNPYVIPGCLHTKREISSKTAVITGWGYTHTQNPSHELLKATLDIVNHDFCDAYYRNKPTNRLSLGILDDLQICAGSEGLIDACQGDSGGPLQIYNTRNHIQCMYDIIGITSFGKGCGGAVGGYVRVSNYIKWIEDIVWP